MLTIPGLFKHTMTLRRYPRTLDANYTSTGAPSVITTSKCYCHEFSAAELPGAAAMGQKTLGKMLVPYRVGPIKEQDIVDVKFRDASVRTFRVVSVRDNHIMQTVDLERVAR